VTWQKNQSDYITNKYQIVCPGLGLQGQIPEIIIDFL